METRKPTIVRLIEPIVDLSQPDNFQRRWEQGNPRGQNFEKLCITIGGKAVTVAIEHHHPGQTGSLLRATMLIDRNRHKLFVRSVTEAREGRVDQGSRAVAKFLPTLQHSLGQLGLR